MVFVLKCVSYSFLFHVFFRLVYRCMFFVLLLIYDWLLLTTRRCFVFFGGMLFMMTGYRFFLESLWLLFKCFGVKWIS